jgi:nicotinamidase-related amidase
LCKADLGRDSCIPRNQYVEIRAEKPTSPKQRDWPEYQTCKFTAEAIVTEGSDKGEIRRVCASPDCPVHHPKKPAASKNATIRAEEALAQTTALRVPFVHPIADVINRTRALIDAFRRQQLPVVLVNVAGRAPGRTEQSQRYQTLPEGWADLIPELDRHPDDMVVTKRTWGVFASTNLEAQLKARGVTQVVIAVVATGTGVESTARQAYEQGFNVTLAIDAMTDARSEAHSNSLTNVFPRLGETGTTQQIIDLLETRSSAQ